MAVAGGALVGVRILREAEYRAMPWKNGGGTTHEVDVFGDAAEPARPLWRLSIATIERDGPFSDFSGYDRTIVALEGNGVELAFDGGERVRLTRAQQSFSFRGELGVAGRLLDGPVRDFNVMTRRDRYRHRLEFVRIVRGERHAIKSVRYVLVLRGRILVAGQTLEPYDAIALDARSSVEVAGEGEGALLCLVSVRTAASTTRRGT